MAAWIRCSSLLYRTLRPREFKAVTAIAFHRSEEVLALRSPTSWIRGVAFDARENQMD